MTLVFTLPFPLRGWKNICMIPIFLYFFAWLKVFISLAALVFFKKVKKLRRIVFQNLFFRLFILRSLFFLLAFFRCFASQSRLTHYLLILTNQTTPQK